MSVHLLGFKEYPETLPYRTPVGEPAEER